MIKVIAIGNRLMMDDGIAIMVLEKIKGHLENLGIEVIIAETDFEACFHQLNDDDFIIIVDAVYKDLSVGTIYVDNLRDAIAVYAKSDAQHDASIFDLMRLYRKTLNGYFIGIQIAEIGIGYEISEPLKKAFNCICFEIETTIKKMVGRNI